MNLKLNLPVGLFLFRETTIGAEHEAAVFIPEIWANRSLEILKNNTVMVGLCTRDYEDEIASYGNTINVQTRGALSVNDKAEHTSVTLQAPTGTSQAVVLSAHKEISFLVEDVAGSQANENLIDGYVEDSAIAIAEEIDLDLLGEVATVDDITWDPANIYDSILAARTALVVDGKSGSRPRYLVIRDLAELLNVEEFISSDYVTAGALSEGAIGKIAGFEVFEDANVLANVSPSGRHRIAMVRGALTLVSRRLPDPPDNTGVRSATVNADGIGLRVIYGYNMNYLGTQVTIDILYGQKVMRTEWMYDLAE